MKRLLCLFKVKITVKAHVYYQNVTVFTVASELLILLHPCLVLWYIYVHHFVTRLDLYFKVKVTVNVEILFDHYVLSSEPLIFLILLLKYKLSIFMSNFFF